MHECRSEREGERGREGREREGKRGKEREWWGMTSEIIYSIALLPA